MAEEKKSREQVIEELKRELQIEKAFLNTKTFPDGNKQQQVAFTPRVRGDVESEKYPGMYPTRSKTKDGKTNYQEYMGVDKFNDLMEKTVNELRVDPEKGDHQFIGKDTPDNERPVMRARSQGYKFEQATIKTGERAGKTWNKPVPANKDEAEMYRIVAKDASPSLHPESDKEKSAERIKVLGEDRKLKKPRRKHRKKKKQKWNCHNNSIDTDSHIYSTH